MVREFPWLSWWLSGKESACQCRRCRFNLAQEDPLEKEMSTHCSIPAWGIPWRGAWQAIVHGVATSRTQLSDQIANS